jgi:AP-3 complex subunit sigma
LLGRKDDDEKLRVVYRSYATLHFVFVVDTSESELGVLDLIQVQVAAFAKGEDHVVTSLTSSFPSRFL